MQEFRHEWGEGEETPASEPPQITQLLQSWAAGQPQAEERLFDVIYPELRRLAAGKLVGERGRITLQATELANETFLRLVDQRRCDWRSRGHFLAIAATTVRRVLLDHAKRRRRAKRGAGAIHLSLEEALEPGLEPQVEMMSLHLALNELAAVRLSAARVVELRIFGGLNLEEAAEVLGLSRKTVQRRWRFARSWLALRLGSR